MSLHNIIIIILLLFMILKYLFYFNYGLVLRLVLVGIDLPLYRVLRSMGVRSLRNFKEYKIKKK